MSSRNPWSVNNINDFWFLTCPECAFKTKEQHKFQSHAVQNHPQSSELFNDNSKEFEEKLKIEDFDDELSDIDLQDVHLQQAHKLECEDLRREIQRGRKE